MEASDFSMTVDIGRYSGICAVAGEALSGFGVEGDDLQACRAALFEAVSNVARHAYPDGKGAVGIDIRLRPGLAEMTVMDFGVGRNGAKARNGIRVMKSSMDAVSFTDDGGLRVEMRRSLGRKKNGRGAVKERKEVG